MEDLIQDILYKARELASLIAEVSDKALVDCYTRPSKGTKDALPDNVLKILSAKIHMNSTIEYLEEIINGQVSE